MSQNILFCKRLFINQINSLILNARYRIFTYMTKKIPYAVANYEKLVRENFYFVDKTRFIRNLEEYQIPVFLRPRRFGKSLWCSILECYYDVNRADRFDELFGDTDIGREPTPLRNSRMVMRFDFSVVEVKSNVVAMEQSFNGACRDALRVFIANHQNQADFSAALDAASASDAMRLILSAVSSRKLPPSIYHNRRVR